MPLIERIDRETVRVPLWVARTSVLVAYVPICAWAFTAELAREVRSAFGWAWCRTRDEHDAMLKAWRTGLMPYEDREK